jgi:iron complex transport system substrate-binding protein
MRVLSVAAGLLLLTALGGLVFLGRADSQGEGPGPERSSAEVQQPRRIVSLSPSTTEILFALGLGDRVVGVSRYCRYPAEAREKAQVGGYLDPNYEAIVALRPDLVVLRGGNARFVKSFRDLGVNLLEVNHDSVEGILDSMIELGRRGGVEDRARRLVDEIQTQMHRINQQTAHLARPRVIVVVERTLGSGKIQNVYVTGSDGFMNRMILLAGGKNACGDVSAAFPVVSGEGILRMNPEVIIDLVARDLQGGLSADEILRDWRQLPDVEAVKSGRVYLVDDDYAFIPGPRFIKLVEKFAELFHPELARQP